LALIGPFWDPGIKVQIGLIWLIVGVLIVALTLGAAVNMTLVARASVPVLAARAIQVFVPSPAGSPIPRPITLILARSRVFSVNIAVTVYYLEGLEPGANDGVERVIGIGRVQHIQDNGLIQILVLREEAHHAELWERLRNREMTTLSRVLIKPVFDLNSAGTEGWFNE